MATVLNYVTPKTRKRPSVFFLPILLCYLFIPLVAWQGCAIIGETQYLVERPAVDLHDWIQAEAARRDWERDDRAGLPHAGPEPPVPVPTNLGSIRNWLISGTDFLSLVADVALLLRLIRAGWNGVANEPLGRICAVAAALDVFGLCTLVACAGPTWAAWATIETYFGLYCRLGVLAGLIVLLFCADRHSQMTQRTLLRRMKPGQRRGEMVAVSTAQLFAFWPAALIVDLFSPARSMIVTVLIASVLYQFVIALTLQATDRKRASFIWFVRWGFFPTICVVFWATQIVIYLFMGNVRE